jgi:hypothetical protein
MKEHHVPAFMLSRWTGADRMLDRHLVARPGRQSRKSPAAFGYLRDYTAFSDPLPPGIDKNAFEKATQRLDSDAARVLEKMLAGERPSAIEQGTWAQFLMFMRLREPEHVAKAREEGTRTLLAKLVEQPDEYNAAAHGEDLPPTLEAFVRQHRPGLIENAGLLFLPSVLEDRTAHKQFYELPYKIGHFAGCSRTLLLSDRPMMLIRALGDPQVTVVMPLSPTAAYIGVRDRELQQKLEETPPDLLVQRINEESLNRAQECVFAADHTNRDLIERMQKARDAA